MKTVKIIALLCLSLLVSIGFAQHGHGHHKAARHGHRGKVVVHRSPYRPNKVVVYRPHWRPAYACNRRWVYFPARNMYWDNWRNHYVFWNGTIWISQASAPAVIVNVNLEKEKTVELKEDEDDVDDIYKSNKEHQSNYKNE